MKATGEPPIAGGVQVEERWPGMETGEGSLEYTVQEKKCQLGHGTDLLVFLSFLFIMMMMIDGVAKNVSDITLCLHCFNVTLTVTPEVSAVWLGVTWANLSQPWFSGLQKGHKNTCLPGPGASQGLSGC